MYEIMKMTIADRNKVLQEILQIEGASVLQVSGVTGVPYHFVRYAE